MKLMIFGTIGTIGGSVLANVCNHDNMYVVFFLITCMFAAMMICGGVAYERKRSYIKRRRF